MSSEAMEQSLGQGLCSRNIAIAIAANIEADASRLGFSGPVADCLRAATTRIRSLARSYPLWHDVERQTSLVREAWRGCDGDQEGLCRAVGDWSREWGNFAHHLSNVGNFLFKELRHAEEPNPADVERPGDAPCCRSKRHSDELKNVNRNLLFAEIATGNCVPAALPPKFSIDTTNVCNFRCRHCHQGLRQEFHHTHLDLRSVDKIAQGMPVAEDMTLGGTGEPLLSPALPALCALAQRHQVRSEIITNGVALNNPKIPRGSGGVWSVSFDGAVKRTFEAIRVGSPFETIVQRIGDFCQRNPQLRVILNMVVCRANLDEIYGVAEWAVKFRANVNLNKLFAYMEHLEPLALRKSDAAALQEQIRRATQLCAQHGLRLAHSVYLDDAPDGSEPLDKEKLLAALEAMPVTQGVPIGDLKASCAMLENHSYDYLPRPLMEAVASAARSVRVPEPGIPAPITGRGGALDIGRMTRRYKQLGRRIRRLPAEEIRVPYCLSPWTRLYVEASSFLRPCCVWPGHFVDLKDFDTLQDALSAEEFRDLRQKTLEGAELPKPCRNCTFAERYFGLPQFLQFLIDHGVDVLRLRLPPNFSPPDEAKVMLSPESRQQALEILDWGPQSVERGAKFNLQPCGLSRLWARCKGPITSRTYVVWERRPVRTEADVAGQMLYAWVPDEFYARAGQYRIHVIDPIFRRRSAEVQFSVKGPVARPHFLQRWLRRSENAADR